MEHKGKGRFSMNGTFITLGALALTACLAQPESTQDGSGPREETKSETESAEVSPDERRTQKPGAPVHIQAVMNEGGARVEIAFQLAARDVEVQVDGLDGLVLASGPTTVRESFVDDGQRLAFQVAFAPVQEPSTLSVLVSGQFHGAYMSRAASFTVGDPALFRTGRSAEQREITDAEGNRIKVAGQAEKR